MGQRLSSFTYIALELNKFILFIQNFTTEAPLFPGARTTWTEKLEFTGKDTYAPIPVYRVMDRQGNIIHVEEEPILSTETLVKMYKDMKLLGILDKILYEAQRQGNYYLSSNLKYFI